MDTQFETARFASDVPAAYEHLRVACANGVLTVCIDRPGARNALSEAVLRELGRAFDAKNAPADLKAAVLTGTGGDAFASGGDLKELHAVRSAEQAASVFERATTALDAIRNCPVPVIAALNGVALGGGAELALACDFRIASPQASIGYIQPRLNITSGFGGGADLMRALGPSRGLLHALQATALDARAAQEAGLVDAVAQDGEPLADCVQRFLEPVLRLTPDVIRAFKAMAVAERRGVPLEQRRALEKQWFLATWTHEDHWAAVERMTAARAQK